MQHIELLGDTFNFFEDEGSYFVYHSNHPVSGQGKTLSEAVKDLYDCISEVKKELNENDPKEFRDWISIRPITVTMGI